MPAANFCQAVSSGDVKTLSRINGIGKRTAERLIVELKEKLSGIAGSAALPSVKPELQTALSDAALALEQLGFKRDEVDRTLRKLASELPEAECGTENLLKRALQILNF